jgi:hypothetical protein
MTHSCMQALEEGDEEEARRQHEVACDLLTESGGISARLEELYAIEDGIGESTRTLASSVLLDGANGVEFVALTIVLLCALWCVLSCADRVASREQDAGEGANRGRQRGAPVLDRVGSSQPDRAAGRGH